MRILRTLPGNDAAKYDIGGLFDGDFHVARRQLGVALIADQRREGHTLDSKSGGFPQAHAAHILQHLEREILFGTQASTRPPRFVIFASGFLEAGYRRFIERRLREQFGFVGSPIEVSVRVREKRKR